MKREAIILVAGMGTRLKPLTLTTHKCLTKVNGTVILYNALDNLSKLGVQKVSLVTGYLANTIEEAVGEEYKGMKVSYVSNDIFDETNTSYSMLKGLGNTGDYDELFILEGDVFFSGEIFEKLVNDVHSNGTLLEPYREDLDGTFVELDSDGYVIDWTHKSMRPDDYDVRTKYKTINLHKFQKQFVEDVLLPHTRISCDSENGKEPLENIMREIVRNNKKEIFGVLSDGLKWFEIDDVNDLHIAEQIFSEE